MEAKKKTGMFDKQSMKLGSVHEEEKESISILESDGEIEQDQKETQMPVAKVVGQPKLFNEKKGQEVVFDAKRKNSLRRPREAQGPAMRQSIVVVGQKSEASMADETFSDEGSE